MMSLGRHKALIATILLAAAAFAADEKVEFKGSTSFELPKPTRNFEPSRTYNGGEKEQPDMSGGYVPPVRAANSPLVDKKFKEMMDKKKNWIFLDPYKEHFDGKTAEFMKGEKGTGLFDQRWMNDKEEKGAVEKFLTEKQGRHDDETHGKNEKDDADVERNSKKEANEPRGLALETSSEKENFRSADVIEFGSRDDKPGTAGTELRTADDKKFTDRLERTPRFVGEQRPEMTATERERFKKDQQAHDAEFGQLLRSITPSASGASLPGRADPLNPSLNLGAQGPNQFETARPGQSIGFGRGDTPGFGFTGNNPLSANLPSANRSVNEDFGPKAAAKPSVFAPPSGSLSPAQAPSFAPSPFQLPFPQRKF